ncbi:hypothetical protein [Streptomyces sp. FH025]|uniref:hypothetical protein n=1 Tax=Streptomyces sp. FH025 TaxID=2815937 RepID=UPI001A9F2F50|nr:hypothetical protein [Streptomyces sp. FH025]MBO1420070.1 hypothetical protein [Streptomyces sp. FH025]
METATLLLLGAAGGSLRVLVDLYNSTMEWREARRAHRQANADEPSAGVPVFRDFVDLWPDLLAAAFHTALGAGAAAMFGSTGQISGAYAAIAVGISAPAVLAHLGQVQSVREAVAGAPSPGSLVGPRPVTAGPDVRASQEQESP